MKITGIYIYPIKSMGGISLNSSEVTERGLALDRRWVLVDENFNFLSQREIKEMAKFSLGITKEFLEVTNTILNTQVLIPLITKSTFRTNIKVWSDTVEAIHVGNEYDAWFTENLGLKCFLYYQPDDSVRLIDKKYSITGQEQTSLSDGYPILIAGEESLTFLNKLCPETIDMLRFRPNLVFSGGNEFCEDNFKRFKLGTSELFSVKRCARCTVTTIDLYTLQKSKEPLLTLSKFRKDGNKILFGQNLVVTEKGFIQLGDQIILED